MNFKCLKIVLLLVATCIFSIPYQKQSIKKQLDSHKTEEVVADYVPEVSFNSLLISTYGKGSLKDFTFSKIKTI